MNQQQPIMLETLATQRRQFYSGWRLSLDRKLQLLRTFPPNQILHRLWKTAKTKTGLWYVPKNMLVEQTSKPLDGFARLFELHEPQQRNSFEDIANGRISLLNSTCDLGSELVDWYTEGVDPRPAYLWRFQLHYHEFLLDLARQDATEASWRLVWQRITDWIKNVPPENRKSLDSAWHPYCISRRIPCWLLLFAANRPGNVAEILTSIHRQVDSLWRNLELDLRGNHLLENLKTLAMAICFLNDEFTLAWRDRFYSLLQSELEFQTLRSGEHYERSPMYHCVVLANLLQLMIVSENRDSRIYEISRSFAERMLEFIQQILHPDGEIPLFSDACFGEGPSLAQLEKLCTDAKLEASFQPKMKTNESGFVGDYWTFRNESDAVILDAGELAAQGLPGHAHCDLVNFEISINSRRTIIDSGNYSYADDSMRRYCRSSVAHNVLTVDSKDHADCWSNFRMGYRGSILGRVAGVTDGYHWIKVSHDAYRRSGIARIDRMFVSHKNQVFLCFDHIPTNEDHLVEGFLNFAPGFSPTQSSEHSFTVSVEGQPFHIRFLNVEQCLLGSGWYCDEFGKREEKKAIVYCSNVNRSTTIGWVLSPLSMADDLNVTLPDPAKPEIQVVCQGQSTFLSFES